MRIYKEFSWDEYTPPDEAVDLLRRVDDQNKFGELEDLIELEFPDGFTEMELDDFLRDYDGTLEEELGLEEENDEEEDGDIIDYDQDERGY